MNNLISDREWLEADGLGGFASGTSTGVRTRRYHALLLAATTPPTGRFVLVNGFDAWVETANGTYALSTQHYAPDVLGGDGAQSIERFDWEPWPRWIYRLPEGTRIELELFAVKGEPGTVLSWRVLGRRQDVRLHVRPFLSGRDYHALHHRNADFAFDARVESDRVSWQPYQGVPGVTAFTNGRYLHDPVWYTNFLYREEQARGLDCQEDLAAPGVFSWELGDERAVLILTTKERAAEALPSTVQPLELFRRRREAEAKRRQQLGSPLARAADAYIVRRGAGQTLIAGYPWFTDWGRDTFIALRGLCLATGRLEVARDILLAWSEVVSAGMLPNRFPDQGGEPEYNAVDASLWFVIAVQEFLRFAEQQRFPLHGIQLRLLAAVRAIVEGYAQGTRFGIRVDVDGLLRCGEPGVQLTWMDAKVGDWVVTPRVGKPVEVQALWLNALWVISRFDARWKAKFEQGLASFRARFWNPDRKYLYDVVDVNHDSGSVDASFRPNQIFAVGGLPVRLLEPQQGAWVVEAVRQRLWTPLGLRSLAPMEPGYVARYQGGVHARDGAYHQGTVWPWLSAAFVDAWVWVHGQTPGTIQAARSQFLQPLLDHLGVAGLGHISEIADAEEPHTPRGCPWQAWSVGEALWLDQIVLQSQTGSMRPRSTLPTLPPQLATPASAARRKARSWKGTSVRLPKKGPSLRPLNLS